MKKLMLLLFVSLCLISFVSAVDMSENYIT